MPKDDLEMEEKPRSFRCENVIGRLVDEYAKSWERSDSWVVRWILRTHFEKQLPISLKPNAIIIAKKKKPTIVNWSGSSK